MASVWRRLLPEGYADLLRTPRAAPRLGLFETPIGKFHLLENDVLAQHLIRGEIHEPHFCRLADLLLNDDDTVLDLGANFGSHSVYMAGRVPKGRVLAFEPLGLTHSQLQLNLIANGCDNVAAYKLAVSDRTGEVVRMQAVDYCAARVNVGATRVARRGGGDAALTLRIDDLDLKDVAFVKMDIQGSETAALRGMADTIARHRPVMFVEIEEKHLRACASSSKELMELILGHGYVLYRILTDYPCDHLAVPAERVQAVEPLLRDLDVDVQEILGRTVELEFSDSAYTYSAIRTR